jgi:hypothetical protein
VRWAVANTSTCGTNGNSSDTCTGMVAHLSDWDNYVTNLVQRYDGTTGHGRIAVYEIWNEPANPQDWTDTQTNLAILAREVVKIIRANDAAKHISPPTQISTPSGPASYFGGFMNAYVAQGGSPSDFDSVSLHAYYAVSDCGGLPAPCAEAVANDASAFRSQMASHGLSGKPLIDTEGSWGSPADYGSLTSAQQVAFTGRWFLMHWSLGITRMMWYAMDNSQWGTFCSGGGAPCPLSAAGTAYNEVYSWMVGSTMNSACTPAGTIYTCGLALGDGTQALAVWNTAGNSVYSPAAQYVKYKDLAGNSTNVSGGVTIGIQPILLLGGTAGTLPLPPSGLAATVQ